MEGMATLPGLTLTAGSFQGRSAARTVRMSRNIRCGPPSAAPSIGTKPYRAYQLIRSRYASVTMQRQPTSSATRRLMRNASEISARPRPRPANRRSTASRASKISGRSYGGNPRTYFFGNTSRGTLAIASVKITEDRSRSALVDGDVGHANRALLLIAPCVALQVVVEGFVAAIEVPDLVAFFEAANNNGHSVPQSPHQRLRRRIRFGG